MKSKAITASSCLRVSASTSTYQNHCGGLLVRTVSPKWDNSLKGQEGKQSNEKPGVAVCGESRQHGFEWEA